MELQIAASAQSALIPLSPQNGEVGEESDELPAAANDFRTLLASIRERVPVAIRNEQQQLREFILYLEVLDVSNVGWEPKSTRWTSLQVEVCGICKTCPLPSASAVTDTDAVKGGSAGGSATELHFVLQDYFAETKVVVRILSSTLLSRSVVAERVVTLRDLLRLPPIELVSSTTHNSTGAHASMGGAGTSQGGGGWGDHVRLSLPLSANVSGVAKGSNKDARPVRGQGGAPPPTATAAGGGVGVSGGVNMWLLESARGAASMSSQLVELPLPSSVTGLESAHAKARSLSAYTALPERDHRDASVLIKGGGNGNVNGSEGGGGGSPASASLRSVIVVDADDDGEKAGGSSLSAMNIDKKQASLATTESAATAAARGFTLTLQMRMVTLQGCMQLVEEQCQRNKGAEKAVYRRSELHAMAAHGSATVVAHLLATLAKLRSPDAPAAGQQQVSVVRLALSLRDSYDRRPLDVALWHGNLATVRVLLQRVGHFCFEGQRSGTGTDTGAGAGVVVEGMSESTALHHAVAGGNVACVQLLIKFLRKYAATLTTGLMGAGMAYHPQLQTHASMRLSLPAMLEARDLFDNTPLMATLDVVSNASVATGVAPNTPTPSLSSSASSSSSSSTSSPSSVLEIVRVLVQAGADVAAVNRHTLLTPFMLAARSGNVAVVEYLLTAAVPRREAVASLTEVAAVVRYFSRMRGHQPQAQSQTQALTVAQIPGGPQNAAASNDRSHGSSRTVTSINELLHPLTLYKCRPYLKDFRGCDALMLAAEAGHVAVVDTCLRIGFDATGGQDVTLLIGETALHLAARGGHLAVCELLAAAERIAWRAHRVAVEAQSFSGRPRKPRLLTMLSGGGKRAADLARAAGHADLALRLEALALEIYGEGEGEGDGTVPRSVRVGVIDGGDVGVVATPVDDHDYNHDLDHDDAADEVEHCFALAPVAARGHDLVGSYDPAPPPATSAAAALSPAPSPADDAAVTVTATAVAVEPAVVAGEGGAVGAKTGLDGSVGPRLAASHNGHDDDDHDDHGKYDLAAPISTPVPALSIDAAVSSNLVPLEESVAQAGKAVAGENADHHSSSSIASATIIITTEEQGSTAASIPSTVIAPMRG